MPNHRKNERPSPKILRGSTNVIYYVWCANCGYETKVRGGFIRCPSCDAELHEKRWLN